MSMNFKTESILNYGGILMHKPAYLSVLLVDTENHFAGKTIFLQQRFLRENEERQYVSSSVLGMSDNIYTEFSESPET